MKAKTTTKTKVQTLTSLVSKMTPHEKLEYVHKLIEASDEKVPMEDGKLYMKVHERIRLFRAVFGFDVRIDSFAKEITSNHALFECQLWIRVPQGDTVVWEFIQRAHSHQVKISSMINETSYVENAETSAIGRCLSFMGASGGDSISSAEELVLALESGKNIGNAANKTAQKSGIRKQTIPSNTVNRSTGKKTDKNTTIKKETLAEIEAYLENSKNTKLRAITINSLKRSDGAAVTRFEEITEAEGQGVLERFKLLEEDPEML